MNLLLLVTLLLITARWRACGYKPEIERSLRTGTSYCEYRLDVRWNRSDCGQQNRTKEWCESRGCCWDPNKDTLMCFYPNRQEETRDLPNRGRRRRQTGVQAKPVEFGNCLCKGIEKTTGGPGNRNFNVNCHKNKKNDEKEKNVPSTSWTNNEENNVPSTSNKKRKEKNVPKSSKKKGKEKIVPTNSQKQASKQEKATLYCKFRGNPHPCSDYNHNQQAFYDELLKIVGNKMCNTFNLPQPECPNEEFHTVNLCPEIKFMLTDRF